MLRALLWKEWRTQRPLLAAALAITALLPLLLLSAKAAGSHRSVPELTQLAAFVMTICVWPVFAALTGAMVFGQETSDGSLRFLLSRPVSRTRLWVVKVASVLGIYAGLLVATAAVALGFYRASGGVFPDLSRASNEERILAAAALVGVCIFLLLCAAYCSLFVHRPLTAAMGGTVIAGGVVALAGAVWQPFLAGSEYARVVGFAAGTPNVLIIGIFGVAAATFREFGRGDAIRGVSVKAALKPLVLVVLSIVIIGAGPVAYAALAALATADARVSGHLAIVDGAIVTTEVADNGLTTRIVRIDPLTGERRVLVAGHATMPSVSPDGHWIAYAHFDGYRAELAREFSVRAVRVDGSQHHPVLDGATFSLPENWARDQPKLSIDPGSEFVAAVTPSGRLLVGALAGGAPRVVESAGDVVGWIAQTSELLWHRVERVGGRRSLRLTALDPRTTATRAVGDFAGFPLSSAHGALVEPFAGGPRGGWRWFPVQLERRVPAGREVALHLVALRLGALQPRLGEMPAPVADAMPPCGGTGWFSDDGERFFYGRGCPDAWRQEMVLRVRDLGAGTDREFATLSGMRAVFAVHESPDAERLLVHGRSVSQSPGAFIVERDETPRKLAHLAMPVGWLDDENVVLLQRGGTTRRLRIVNVDSGLGYDVDSGFYVLFP